MYASLTSIEMPEWIISESADSFVHVRIHRGLVTPSGLLVCGRRVQKYSLEQILV